MSINSLEYVKKKNAANSDMSVAVKSQYKIELWTRLCSREGWRIVSCIDVWT
jgi:hypothetical protein